MFAKKQRYSFKKGLPAKTISFPSFSLRYDKNDEGVKVAVVVSKKVDKRATVRNKIRRKVLEILKDKLNQESLNLIFYIKGYALQSSSLEQEIEDAINKVK